MLSFEDTWNPMFPKYNYECYRYFLNDTHGYCAVVGVCLFLV